MSINTFLPSVSIITPSYQQANYLEETILSVLNQDYPNIEYIIIDGGSNDGSVDIIRKYEQRISYWISESDCGQAHAINKGLRQATGDFLSWLNSDDTLTTGTVSRVVNYFNTNENIDIVYGLVNRIDFQGNLIDKPRPSAPPLFSTHTMIGDRLVIQPGSFWRRKMMDKVGLLDESLHFVMDYEFWVRIALAGGKFAYLGGDPVANFRLSEGTKTQTQFHLSGLEELSVIDRLVTVHNLAEIMGLSDQELKRLELKARAIACLKVFKAYGSQPGKNTSAIKWLFKAVKYHPLSILHYRRLLVRVFLDRFFSYH